MSEKKKLILALLLALLLIGISVVFTLSIVNVTKNPMETKEDYERILGTLDEREWKVSEGTSKALSSLIPSSKGEATTIKDGDRIVLTILLSSGDKRRITFSYKDGRILSLYGSQILYLEYTETVYGGGRSLTIFYGNEKIIFKEKR